MPLDKVRANYLEIGLLDKGVSLLLCLACKHDHFHLDLSFLAHCTCVKVLIIVFHLVDFESHFSPFTFVEYFIRVLILFFFGFLIFNIRYWLRIIENYCCNLYEFLWEQMLVFVFKWLCHNFIGLANSSIFIFVIIIWCDIDTECTHSPLFCQVLYLLVLSDWVPDVFFDFIEDSNNFCLPVAPKPLNNDAFFFSVVEYHELASEFNIGLAYNFCLRVV